jgi:hypothetical protein
MNFDDPTHIFIIAEAGSNWKCGTYEEDLNQSKNLIKYTAKAIDPFTEIHKIASFEINHVKFTQIFRESFLN